MDLQSGSGDWFMPPNSYPVPNYQAPITGIAMVPDVAGMLVGDAITSLTQAGFTIGDTYVVDS